MDQLIWSSFISSSPSMRQLFQQNALLALPGSSTPATADPSARAAAEIRVRSVLRRQEQGQGTS